MSAPFQLIFDLGLEDLNPIMAGEDDLLPGHQVQPRLFNSVVIHHIRRGRGTLYMKNKEYQLGPGQGFIMLPGEVENVHYKADLNDPWEYAWIGFTGKLAHHFSVLPPVFDLPEGVFPNMYDLKHAPPTIGYLLASDLFFLYGKLLKPQLAERDFPQLIMEHIQKNYMQKLSVEEFAVRFNMDRRYLSQQFKEKMGFTIRSYLTETRLTQAATLIQQGQSSKAASEACGFGNVSNFHKMFRARFGMTPLEWKERFAERT